MSVHASLKSLPEWNRLVELVRELAFLDGGSDDAFTLASGRQSRWFFDMKPVMMHTESSKLLAHLFNHRLDDLNPDFVGGLVIFNVFSESGAFPLFQPPALSHGMPDYRVRSCECGFLVLCLGRAENPLSVNPNTRTQPKGVGLIERPVLLV